MKTETIKAVELVEDFDLYPRSAVDSTHVTTLALVLESGSELPPIIVDQKNRVIDGFHRRRAHLRVLGDRAVLKVERRQYDSDQAAYLDALKCNAKHGKGITGSERTGAIIKARTLKIEPEIIASALNIRVERVNEIVSMKVTHIRSTKVEIPLKRSVKHFSRRKGGVTKKQADVIKHAPGQAQGLLLRQVNDLIENDMINLENKTVVEQLQRLIKNVEILGMKIA